MMMHNESCEAYRKDGNPSNNARTRTNQTYIFKKRTKNPKQKHVLIYLSSSSRKWKKSSVIPHVPLGYFQLGTILYKNNQKGLIFLSQSGPKAFPTKKRWKPVKQCKDKDEWTNQTYIFNKRTKNPKQKHFLIQFSSSSRKRKKCLIFFSFSKF